MNDITSAMANHHAKIFSDYGPTARGVDWRDELTANTRYEKMLAVVDDLYVGDSLLDVGCGYGGLLQYIHDNHYSISYRGIDVVPEMVQYAKSRFSPEQFECSDVMRLDENVRFDYVVCNGILTQKLDISLLQMDVFAKALIKKMFSLCNKGIAFNVMTTYVNFFAPNLFYKHPAELMIFCFSDVTHSLRMDHSYGLYEYTFYLFR